MRTTKETVYAVFAQFAKSCGKARAHSYNHVGAWQLDYNAIYGGWEIQEIMNTSGGVSLPFGPRLVAREFVQSMRFAMRASEIYRFVEARKLSTGWINVSCLGKPDRLFMTMASVRRYLYSLTGESLAIGAFGDPCYTTGSPTDDGPYERVIMDIAVWGGAGYEGKIVRYQVEQPLE